MYGYGYVFMRRIDRQLIFNLVLPQNKLTKWSQVVDSRAVSHFGPSLRCRHPFSIYFSENNLEPWSIRGTILEVRAMRTEGKQWAAEWQSPSKTRNWCLCLCLDSTCKYFFETLFFSKFLSSQRILKCKSETCLVVRATRDLDRCPSTSRCHLQTMYCRTMRMSE